MGDTQIKKILSLGAGVQSSTILVMSCYGELEKLDGAIFSDTGWETKATYDWLENVLKPIAKKYGIPIYHVGKKSIKQDALLSQVRGTKNKKTRWASMPYFTISSDGKKGRIKRQCTKEYKIEIIEKTLRKILGYKPRQRIPVGLVESWIGISTDEANRVRMSDKKWITNYYPLIEKRMSRQACLYWFSNNGLPQPPRSSCIGCPNRTKSGWRELKVNSITEFNEAVDFDKKIRKCGGIRGDVYLHQYCRPLDELDFRNDIDKGQMLLFDDECAGLCGV